jgi:hypothetical protein
MSVGICLRFFGERWRQGNVVRRRNDLNLWVSSVFLGFNRVNTLGEFIPAGAYRSQLRPFRKNGKAI